MKVFKAVTPHYLESATREGWVFERVLPTTHYEKVQCTTPIAIEGYDGSNGSYGAAGTVQLSSRDELVQVHEPVFILSKELDVITVEEQLRKDLQAANDKLKLADQRNASDTRDLGIQKNKIEGLESDLGNLRSALADERKIRSQIENHLGKIRTAIGTTRYDEILSS